MSFTVTVLLEVHMQLQNAPVKGALESVPLGHLPLTVHDCERNVFVRRSGVESYCHCVVGPIRFEEELRGFRLVSQVWVEDIELVTLNDFWWRVVGVIMCLIVLVPFESLLDAVVEPGFSLNVDALQVGSQWLGVDYVSEFHLVGTQPLFLGFVEHC
jgi:hypothetical protein